MAKRGRKPKAGYIIPEEDKRDLKSLVKLFCPFKIEQNGDIFTLHHCWVAKTHLFIPQYAVDLYNSVFLKVEIDAKNNIVKIWANWKKKKEVPDEDGIYILGEPLYTVRGLISADPRI